jgi:hypothetical protein
VSFGLAVLAYALTLWLLPRGGFWIVDEGCKLIQTEGIVRNGYRGLSVPWPGLSIDPDLLFNPLPIPFGFVRDGSIFAVFSSVFALMSAAPYQLLGATGLYLIPLASGLLVLPAVWMLAGSLPSPRVGQPLALLLTALGTPVWFYSETLWEHTPAVCLAIWAVALWRRRSPREDRLGLAASGLLCGLSVCFRDEMYLFALALAAAVILYDRTPGRSHSRWFCAGVVAGMLPLWIFQWIVLGSPLGRHVGTNAAFYGSLSANPIERLQVIRALLVNSHRSLALSLLVTAPFLVSWALHPRAPVRVFKWLVPVLAGVGTAGGSIVLVGCVRSESPMWNMFNVSALSATVPALMLAFVRMRDGKRREFGTQEAERRGRSDGLERELWFVATGFATLSVLAVPHANAAGVHWGARILLPLYPLLALLAAGTLSTWWELSASGNRAVRALPVAVIALSVVLQGYGLRLLHDRKAFTAEVNDAILARAERVVVVDYPGFLPELARCFYSKVLVLVQSREAISELPAFVARAGGGRVLFVLSRDVAGPGREDQTILRDPLSFATLYLRSVEFPPE